MTNRKSPSQVLEDNESGALHSIGDVATATGISPDTIRVWERRYGRPKPVRLPSGHRRYTSEQVRWLRRIAEALSRGNRPSVAVRASDAELEAMLAPEDEAQSSEREIMALVDLVRGFEQTRLVRSLRRDSEAYGPERFLEERVAPLLHRVGRLWADGELDVRHEHFLSEVLEDLLRALRTDMRPRPEAGLVLFATLPDEEHGLGIQMAALVCAAEGYTTRILGRQTPIGEIVRAARETRAFCVALSVSLSSGGVETDRRLVELRRELPDEVHLVIGGKGARGVRRGARGIVYVENFSSLRDWLSGR